MHGRVGEEIQQQFAAAVEPLLVVVAGVEQPELRVIVVTPGGAADFAQLAVERFRFGDRTALPDAAFQRPVQMAGSVDLNRVGPDGTVAAVDVRQIVLPRRDVFKAEPQDAQAQIRQADRCEHAGGLRRVAGIMAGAVALDVALLPETGLAETARIDPVGKGFQRSPEQRVQKRGPEVDIALKSEIFRQLPPGAQVKRPGDPVVDQGRLHIPSCPPNVCSKPYLSFSSAGELPAACPSRNAPLARPEWVWRVRLLVMPPFG